MIKELQDKEWLEERYINRSMTYQEIANELECNKATIGRALKRHGIQARTHSSKYPKLNDKDWLREVYAKEGKSLNEIADIVGSTAANIASHLDVLGVERRTSSEGLRLRFPEGRSMENHPRWVGGKIERNGYVWVRCPDHPKANSTGYVQEHRLVAEECLDRILKSNEIVHHIDGDKTNNNPDNLEVMGRGDHFRLHYNSYQRMIKLEMENRELKKKIERLTING